MKRLLLFFAFLLSAHILFAQVKVNFVIKNLPVQMPEPKSIYMAGNFNDWSPAKAAWQFTNNSLQQNLAPGNYEYKLVRGSWDKVECGPNGAGFGNRSLHLVHDTTVYLTVADWQDLHPPIQRTHTASANVHIITEKFDMPQLGKQRRVWIYLPKGYQTGKQKYPVIYMHDGQNLFDGYTSGFGEWGVDEFMDSLKAGQQQFIVVGVDHGGDARVVEYSPYASKYGQPLGDKYVDFLVETLKPYIDSHYRTLTDARHTAVAGSSMGGLISMYAELKYPRVFGSAGVFSPAFWINPPIYEYAKAHAAQAKRFYFVCGDQEGDTMDTDMLKMADISRNSGLSLKNTPTTVIKGAKHNEAQWRGAFPAFYQWLVAGMK
ncbi:alpha/beta hydrolase-fold protein [Mucilaginibacter sp. AW1-3]